MLVGVTFCVLSTAAILSTRRASREREAAEREAELAERMAASRERRAKRLEALAAAIPETSRSVR